jgi:hypothetical protein
VDCLRIKRRAEGSGWLAKREPNVDAWLKAHHIPLPYNATWVSHQFGNKAGLYVATYVLADARLLEPKTRSSAEFLRAGQPAVKWSRDLAHAVRVSTSMLDGRLDVPPFPLPQPVGPAVTGEYDAPADAEPAPSRGKVKSLPPLRTPEREPARPPRPQQPDRG